MLESIVTLFALVLTRLSGLLIAGTLVFGHSGVPIKIRGLIAIALTMLVTPTLFGVFVPPPSTVIDLGWLVLSELVLGAALGVGLAIIFGGLTLAGDIIDQQAGFSIGQVFNPATGDMTTQTGTFLVTVMTVVLLVLEPFGIEEQMIRGVLDTFSVVPPGKAAFSASLTEMLVDLGHQSIILGVKVAAPVVAVGALVTITLGFLGASVQQINVLTLGLAIRAGVSIFVLVFTIGPAGDAVIDMSEAAMESLSNELLSEPNTA